MLASLWLRLNSDCVDVHEKLVWGERQFKHVSCHSNPKYRHLNVINVYIQNLGLGIILIPLYFSPKVYKELFKLL